MAFRNRHRLLACAASCLATVAGAGEAPAPPADTPAAEAPRPDAPLVAAPPADAPPAVAPAADSQHAAGSRVVLPALTHVRIQIDEPVNSNGNKPGDHFRLHIAEDVRVGDAVLIPAGAEGVGEVVHAAPSGGGGKPGALILAAREVRVGDQPVRLRSLVLGRSGKDRTQQSMATSFVAGPFAMFVHGGEVAIPAGTEADAKTAEDVELPVVSPPAAATPAQPGSDNTTTEGRTDEQHEQH